MPIERPFVDGQPVNIVAWWYRFLKPVSDGLAATGALDGDDGTGWQTPDLLNGWTPFGDSYPPPQWKRRGRLVMMRGGAKNSTITTASMFTLDQEIRPTTVKLFPGLCAYAGATEGYYRVDVRGPQGDVAAIQVETGATYAYAFLDNIVYRVDT
jgi:hypothetical protein